LEFECDETKLMHLSWGRLALTLALTLALALALALALTLTRTLTRTLTLFLGPMDRTTNCVGMWGTCCLCATNATSCLS
jgi:hypothetical protein